jgi:glycosyltransferase involved in cell wall biosynthesis
MTAELSSGAAATQARERPVAPRLIILNQSVGPAFLDWLASLTAAHGPLELWSGNAPAQVGPGVTVRRLAPYDNSSVGRRLATWSRFTLQAAWRLLRLGGQTSLFVVTNPPLMPLAARWLRALQGRRYGLLEWDIYPQILDSMGLAGPKNLFYRLWRRSHAGALRNAALVVTLGDHMAAVLQEMAGETPLPLTVAPNWVDTDWLKPWPRAENPFVQEQELQDKLVVLYSGNLGATHSIETILETARLLAGEPRIGFLIIGEGSKRSLVEAAIARGETPTLRLLPLQPANRLPQTLSSGHVGIVTLGAGYEGLSMPSKTYALMAAGNAILGISRPPNDVSDTIARHGCGANFSPDQPQAIAEWIRGLLADPAALARLQSHAREAAMAHYSTAHCTARLNAAVAAALLHSQRARTA